MRHGELRDLLAGGMKGRRLGRRGVRVVAQREHRGRLLVPGSGDGKRGVVMAEERVRGGPTTVITGAANDLADQPIRGALAQARAEACRKIRRPTAVVSPRLGVERGAAND